MKLKELLMLPVEGAIKKEGVYFLDRIQKIYNPYIDGGISGLIMLKLLNYRFNKNGDILSSIMPYIRSLLDEDMICKTGFISGGLGMAAVIHDFAILTNSEELRAECRRKLYTVLLFSINNSEYSFVLDEKFSVEDISFSTGILGYIYVLDKIIKKELIFNEYLFE